MEGAELLLRKHGERLMGSAEKLALYKQTFDSQTVEAEENWLWLCRNIRPSDHFLPINNHTTGKHVRCEVRKSLLSQQQRE